MSEKVSESIMTEPAAAVALEIAGTELLFRGYHDYYHGTTNAEFQAAVLQGLDDMLAELEAEAWLDWAPKIYPPGHSGHVNPFRRYAMRGRRWDFIPREN